MSSTSFDNCSICQYPLVTSGISYPLSYLLPQRQVRKLDGCDHQIHTACFQNWVNMKLATNTEHKGPVPCPSCRQETQGTHSTQELFDIAPSSRTLSWVATMISGALNGVGMYFILSGRETPDLVWKASYAFLGLVIMVAGITAKTFYTNHYEKNPENLLKLFTTYYNLRKGTNVRRKDIAFGMDIELTRSEWLGVYANILPLIRIFIRNESQQLQTLTLQIVNHPLFIEKMEEELGNIKQEDLPLTVQNANKHFCQTAIDPEKQGELLIFLTRLAIEKKIIPVEQEIVQYDCSQVSYENFRYQDEDS